MAGAIYKVCKSGEIQGIGSRDLVIARGRLDMLKKIISTIQKYNLINKGEGIVVGVSGGSDSVCLLHVLHLLSCELGIKLFAFHLNHGLRGAEADEDEAYVAEICMKMGVPLRRETRDIRAVSLSRGISLEEAGRETRYSLLNQYAKEVGADKIAVAHNRNDQAETILMHMLRGSGLQGLTGMEFKQGNLIRPLLSADRSEIESYCREKLLEPRTDSSNASREYTRNRIRLDLIPQMDKTYEGNVTESLLRMANLLKDDQDYLEGIAAGSFQRCSSKEGDRGLQLDINELGKYHPAIGKRVLRIAFREVAGNLKGIESKHVESVMVLSMCGRTGSKITLPQGLIAEKSYQQLRLYRASDQDTSPEFFEYLIKIPGVTNLEELSASLEAELLEKNRDELLYLNTNQDGSIQFFDYEKLKRGINIRYRKAGDIFKPWRSNGTKKLKEYLIDEKIPRKKRDRMPIVAVDGEVLWLVGLKISDKFKVTENTKHILRLEYKNTQKKI